MGFLKRKKNTAACLQSHHLDLKLEECILDSFTGRNLDLSIKSVFKVTVAGILKGPLWWGLGGIELLSKQFHLRSWAHSDHRPRDQLPPHHERGLVHLRLCQSVGEQEGDSGIQRTSVNVVPPLRRKEPLIALALGQLHFSLLELSDQELWRRVRLFQRNSHSGLVCLKGKESVTAIQTASRVLEDVIRWARTPFN